MTDLGYIVVRHWPVFKWVCSHKRYESVNFSADEKNCGYEDFFHDLKILERLIRFELTTFCMASRLLTFAMLLESLEKLINFRLLDRFRVRKISRNFGIVRDLMAHFWHIEGGFYSFLF